MLAIVVDGGGAGDDGAPVMRLFFLVDVETDVDPLFLFSFVSVVLILYFLFH